jgi:flavin reductase (DIM6/NTAB) family NADH-FMN oxidoreductase RutF
VLPKQTFSEEIGYLNMNPILMPRVDYDALEQRFKAQFFNSLAGPKNLCLVGTQDAENRTNLAVFNSLVHIGSNPPLLGIVFRPDSVERHTYENILSTKEYTVNLVSDKDIEAAHQTSARYPRDQSEFGATGLIVQYIDGFHAPIVSSSPVSFGLVFRENVPIALNGTNLIIGEVQWFKFPKEIIDTDGFADLTQASVVGCIGLDAYTKLSILQRFEYAKPDKPPRIKS